MRNNVIVKCLFWYAIQKSFPIPESPTTHHIQITQDTYVNNICFKTSDNNNNNK